jgi:hypothetical protein
MPKGKTVGGGSKKKPAPYMSKTEKGTVGVAKKSSLPSAKKISKAKKLPKPKTSNPFKRGA